MAPIHPRASKEFTVDWSKLHRRKPAHWPGTLRLWSGLEARAENASLAERVSPELAVRFIGNNGAGLLVGLDGRQRVVVLDEVELEWPAVIAPNLEALLACRTVDKPGKAKLKVRSVDKKWKAIEDLLERPKSFEYGFAADEIASLHAEHQAAGALAEFQARFVALRDRHPGKRSLFAKLAKKGISFR